MVTLKNNLTTEIEAKDDQDIVNKIQSGHYSILPVRVKVGVKITKDDILEIIEINNLNKEK